MAEAQGRERAYSTFERMKESGEREGLMGGHICCMEKIPGGENADLAANLDYAWGLQESLALFG